MWMLFGLAIGLSVAVAIYKNDSGSRSRPPQQTREPAGLSATVSGESRAPATAEEEAAPEPRFSFYDMLPNFEVVIPEQESDVRPDRAAAPVEEPGVYVLQAGSFSTPADADRRRAELALLGIESRVQRVSIDDRSYHRVRIGPTDDLDRLNRIRRQLRDAGIDALRIRLGD